MSNSDRGAYTPPTDSQLSFDARRPVRGGGGPPSSTLLISAVILVVLLAGAGFILYRHGGRGPDDAPKPVGTVVADAKTTPPAQAQPEDDSAGLQIYQQDDAAGAAAPTFAPGPEAVQPRPAPQTAPAAQPTTQPQPAATPSLRPAQPAPTGPVVATPRPATEVAAAPVTKPVAAPPKPVVATAPPAKPAAAGSAMVQIGAFSSAALADKGWNDAAAVAPGLAAGKGKKVETVDKDGHTLYRTSVTGFGSRADAQAFCDRLKAAGKSCFVK